MASFMVARMELKFNHFAKIGREAHERMDVAVREIAKAVQEEARVRAPKDTTAMSESVYVSGQQFSDYGERASTAKELRPELDAKGGAEILEELKPDQPLTYSIGVAASYGIYNELGTVRMGPRPFLGPACDAKATPEKLAVEVKKAFRG